MHHHKWEDRPLLQLIKEIAATWVRYNGLWRIYILLRGEGFQDNQKRVHRIYKEEGLNLRSERPKRNKAAAHRRERLENNSYFGRWSMEFVQDQLSEAISLPAASLPEALYFAAAEHDPTTSESACLHKKVLTPHRSLKSPM